MKRTIIPFAFISFLLGSLVHASSCDDSKEFFRHAGIRFGRTPVAFAPISRSYLLDRYEILDYSRFNRMLFLSDGGRTDNVRDLVKTGDGKKIVVSTDIEPKSRHTVVADNNKLPFDSNSFNLIHMHRGLCTCHGCVSCGGIDTERADMELFLRRAIDILDKNDPNSLLLFTGTFPANEFAIPALRLWQTILEDLQLRYPTLQFTVLRSENDGVFNGFAISTDRTTPIAQRIYQLQPRLNPEHPGR